jgi:hypothetical protein
MEESGKPGLSRNYPMPPFPFRWLWPPLLALALTGCQVSSQADRTIQLGGASTPTPPAREAPLKTDALPQAKILFQPQFLWADASVTREGTGFFVRSANDTLAAVTNVQHLVAADQAVREASWLDVRSEESVVTFTRVWGEPGSGGTMEPLDLRSDYLLLPMSADRLPPHAKALPLDSRDGPAEGEAVWLPVKAVEADHGFRAVAGRVHQAAETFITVNLNQALSLSSLNGSPVISQKTGSVIGTLSRGGRRTDGTTVLVLTPADAIGQAIQSARDKTPLSESFSGEVQANAIKPTRGAWQSALRSADGLKKAWQTPPRHSAVAR